MAGTRDSSGVAFAFYHYDPSMGGAIVFILLFISTTGYHIFQMFKSRTWFLIPFVIGVEIIGYIGRAMSSNQSPNWTLGPYIVQTLFLLLAPALLAASIYMFLGRIILVLQAESHALLKRKWLTKIFVTGDVLSFLLQGAGRHFIKYLIPCSCSSDIPWRKHLNVLYVTSFCIIVRNNGYLLHYEIYLYIFDALLMFMTMAIFNIVYPQEIGRLLYFSTDYEMTRLQDEQAAMPYQGYAGA
ncbi:RTA1 like protein-domain-containing protein [Aspergillus alliaceus]|uniref:RTA1 like protein-domain-containing protein n=1 Tax=Petromyces alliaceus TaxID=209559 RepID=UPI0012A473B7|nr:RTA1 like protein-domain-containing protein [Aspergillus alliaceus]KAB8229658.1 RTA1 like protein-domain-containing protein [Aspergillus alliaceus]